MAIIGREPPADIVVPMKQVSARHAEIEHVRDDTYMITDLGSTNGTWVNGKRVQSAFVRPGDRIGLGSHAVDVSAWRHQIPHAAGMGSAGQPAGFAMGRPASVPPPPPMPVPSYGAAPPPPPMMAPPPPPPARAATPPDFAAQPARPGQPGLGTELAVALAAQKSFTGKAFFVWFLYWLFWIPGVVMNFVYWNEAKRIQQMTGVAPSGKGCLGFLLFTHFLLPLIGLILLIVFGGALLKGLFG